jgi:hypothetical protein
MQTVEYETEVVYTSRPLIRWGPVFGGAITAIAVTTLGMALWMAIGYGSSVDWFVDNLQWFFLGTALVGLLVGGIVAGRVAGAHDAVLGVVDGAMVWGLVVVAALIPLSLRTLALANAGSHAAATRTAIGVSSGNLWALFGVLVGGLACTMVGGMLGTPPRQRTARRPGMEYATGDEVRPVDVTRSATYEHTSGERAR